MPNTSELESGGQGLPRRRYVVVGPDRHGVVAHALRLGVADPRLNRSMVRVPLAQSGVRPRGIAEAVPRGGSVMLQVTDRLFGSTPEEAGRVIGDLARRATLAVVLHDIPQPAEGGTWYERRRDAYAVMTRAASVVVVASDHERDCLQRCVHETTGDGHAAERVVVIPLPIEPAPAEPTPPGAFEGDALEVGVLGYLYPGKGVEEVVATAAALRRAGRSVRITCLGAPAEGHAEHASQLAAAAASVGVPFRVTGFVPDRDLRTRLRTVGVPVAPHRHISASASINAWLEAGRRPVTLPSPYARELADRLPGVLEIATDLEAGIVGALGHPARTWLGASVVLGPTAREAARRHAEVLDELAQHARPLAGRQTVIR